MQFYLRILRPYFKKGRVGDRRRAHLERLWCSRRMGSMAGEIRNLGLMAHIDAGKTTTTERMLFYAGKTRALGDVDDGDTITDYMEQERARGITITSAAVSFSWWEHRLNLIDTPGHVDFTMEVERSLRVLDGAVAILDASAGVEAQSLTVWRQADRYEVPRLVYLNKMDKANASVQLCLDSIVAKFKARPLLLHQPIYKGSAFVGVVDLVTMERLEWLFGKDPTGREYLRTRLQERDDLQLWETATTSRRRLVESVADLDDEVAEAVIAAENVDSVPALELDKALRRITLARSGVPVCCGSSYRNVAVQPLLDAVVKYLPSPVDRTPEFAAYYGDEPCALAFKIVHDRQRGRLTFIRVFSGRIERGQKLYDVNRRASEKSAKLLVAFADDFEEVAALNAGDIGVVTGLKNVVTGDTLVASRTSADAALKSYRAVKGEEHPAGAVLAGIQVPPPVFFCSIEPASLMYKKPLEQALECLQVEDPSLTVRQDLDTGQTVIAGMGELHIEIIKDRLTKEYKVDADLGPLCVAYRETITNRLETKQIFDRTLGDGKHHVVVHLSIEPRPDSSDFIGLEVGHGRETRDNVAALRAGHLEALQAGVVTAFQLGPLLGFPVTNVGATLHWCEVAPGTSLAMVSAAAGQAVRQMLHDADVRLLEPVATLEIATDDRRLHAVLADLTPRRARILEISPRGDATIVATALVPLAELMGYSTALRVTTSGTATFAMEFHSYQPMSLQDQLRAIERVTGFAAR